MPMPNALVAVMVVPSMNVRWAASRALLRIPAWYAGTPSRPAYLSASRRVAV